MRQRERIPLHDHVDNDSGGRIDAPTVASIVDGSGGGSSTTSAIVLQEDGADVGTVPSLSVNHGLDATAAGGIAVDESEFTYGGTGDMTAEAFGSTVSAGAVGKPSDAGHRHAMPAAAVTTNGLAMATGKLLGRTTAATGAVEEIAAGAGLTLAAGVLTATATGGGSSGGTTTLPTVVGIGASATGTGNVVPTLPTHAANDILLLFVQSCNQVVTAPAGWTKLGPACGIGTAAAAGATRLTIFWKRDGGSESDPTVTDSGDHTLAVIMGVRGCPTSGDPFVSVGQTRKTTASTTGTAASGATHVDNCLVVNALAHALDSASAVFSSWTNANLTSVTEQIDVATADGNGGGIGVATGSLASVGPFVGTTVTETSTVDVSSTFYMLPSGAGRAGAVDQQVFLTPGADTWAKPTGAKVLQMTGMGGGASGSAGRNAATAAGGGGGGGGMWWQQIQTVASLAATMTVNVGAGGAQTADSDGAASNVGNASTVVSGGNSIFSASGGYAAGASATGSGGTGGGGGGASGGGAPAAAATTNVFGSQPAPGGLGGTTAGAGSFNNDFGGGAGAGGGTTQATSAGGNGRLGGGGGGGGRSNTNVGTGGSGSQGTSTGGATAGAVGTSSSFPELGGGGGAGGTSAAGGGGAGGFPAGGGGGGGSQSGAQHGGAGGDGIVVMTTFC